MSRQYPVTDITVLSAQKATGAGSKVACSGYGTIEFVASVVGQGAGDVITIKVQGSNATAAPDFGSAASATNEWTYLSFSDLDTFASSYDGATGFSWSNSNTTNRFQLTAKGLKWVTINVTTYTDANASGSITAKMNLYNTN